MEFESMELWLDTTDLDALASAHEMEILYGVTTNPSLIASCGEAPEEIFEKLLNVQEGPLAVQITAERSKEMLEQAESLTKFSSRIILKVPASREGWPVIQELSEEGLLVIATAIFVPYQAYLAFKLGAKYVAPYLGRIEEGGANPIETLKAIRQIQKAYSPDGKILAAGLRSLEQFSSVAELGCEAATLSKPLYDAFIATHPSTEKALKEFNKDSKKLFAKT